MPNQQEVKDFELRSEEVQEVLSYVPNWMILWGNTLIFVLAILLVMSAFIIEYPDIVQSQIIITTPHPPVELVAKSTGKIDAIFKKSNDTVYNGEWIAIISNPAKYDDIILLKNWLDTIEKNPFSIDEILDMPLLYLNIGEVQTAYNTLINAISQYKKWKSKDNYNFEVKDFSQKRTHLNSVFAEAEQRLNLTKKEEVIIRQDFNRYKQLFQEGIISKKEFGEKELSLLNIQKVLKNLEADLIRLNLEKSQLTKDLKVQEYTESDNHLSLKLNILEAYNLTKLSFANWKEKYVIESPINGNINLFDIWSNNQFVKTGDKLFIVIPNDEQEIIGICKMGLSNSGKVKKGQEVFIKLEAFPHMEFGTLKGQVAYISEVSMENKYIVKVKFPKQLMTSYDKKIEFQQGLKGHAEIVTKDMNLAERTFFKARDIMSRK